LPRRSTYIDPVALALILIFAGIVAIAVLSAWCRAVQPARSWIRT